MVFDKTQRFQMSLTIHVLFFGSLYFIPSFPFFDSKIYVLILLFNCFISTSHRRVYLKATMTVIRHY